MDDVEARAYLAEQDARFRDLVRLWASDETISNSEFGKMVSNLDWALGMNKIKWFADRNRSGVDESQPGKVE